MQLQTLMLVPSDARDQLAQSVQHREEPMVPEIAVHAFNSHCVQATKKQLVVKRACKRREWDAVQNRQLLARTPWTRSTGCRPKPARRPNASGRLCNDQAGRESSGSALGIENQFQEGT